MTNRLMLAIGALVCAAIGFVCGSMINVPGLSLSRNLNPIHLISILSTVLVALILKTVVEDSRSKGRVRREFITKYIEMAQQRIDTISIELQDGAISCTKAPSLSKRVTRIARWINDALRSCKIAAPNSWNTVENHLRKLNDLLTSSPRRPISQAGLSIHASDGKYRYSEARIQEIELCIDELLGVFADLHIEIVSHAQS